MGSLCGILLFVLWLPALGLAADAPLPDVAVVVRLDRPAGVASPLLYGCSLPPPGTPEARALSPELLRNGSFEMAPPGKRLDLPEGWGRAPGWQLLSCGPKRIIVQAELGDERPLVLIGDRAWKDYHLSLIARKTGGPGGLCILFEVQDAQNHLRWTLGARGNRCHVLESVGRGRARELAPPVVGRIEPGRCYRLDVMVRDGVVSCSLDGRLIHRLDGARFRAAGIGLGAAGATAEYMDLVLLGSRERPLFLLNEPTEAAHDGISSGWEPLQSDGAAVACRWDFLYPFNSHFSQRIQVDKHAGGDAGIVQHGIPLAADAVYRGRVYLRGVGKPAVEVSLRSRNGKVYAREELEGVPDAWKLYEVVLKPSVTDPAADFCISAKAASTVSVDRVSLARADEPDALALRRDVVEALRALRPSQLRWPTDPAPTQYDWKRGVGFRDGRPILAATVDPKGGFEPVAHDFGTDELLALCKEVGAAPIVTINPEPGVRAARDWVEYCNGAADTIVGKLRAAAGHTQPYGVQLWEIAAQPESERSARPYPEVLQTFSKALREQDPAIHVHEALTDWSPTAPAAEIAATAAVALNRMARQEARDTPATCRLVALEGSPASAQSLITVGPGTLKTSPAYEVLKLFRACPVAGLYDVELRTPVAPGAKGAGKTPTAPVDALAGRDGERLVLRVVNRGSKEARASVAFEGLGEGRLGAQAAHFSIRGTAEARTELEQLAVAEGRLTLSLAPRSVHLLVLRLEGK